MSPAVTAPSLFTEMDARASFVVGRLEFHLLEIEDDVGDVFDHAGEAGEFVWRAFDAHGGDGGAFEGGEQDAAEGIADGVAVTGFKRLGDEFGVGFCGRGLVFDEGLRHLESSETNWHVFYNLFAGFPWALIAQRRRRALQDQRRGLLSAGEHQ